MMKSFAAAVLLTLSSSLMAAVATASTNPVWFDSVASASVAAEAAQVAIAQTNDCAGLEEFLTLGASGSDIRLSGTLGELRNRMLELDAAEMAEEFQDPSAQEGLIQIKRLKAEVRSAMSSRLHFCGNGVEKRSAVDHSIR